MNKKLWVHCLTVSSLALLLAGCGDDDTPKEQPPSQASEVKVAPESKKDPSTSSLEQLVANAKTGNAGSQTQLGVYYDLRGNYKEAYNWYQKAALQGSAAAQRSLGKLYDEGNGVEANSLLAYSWYRKAALQNDGEALIGLMSFFNEGIIVDQDLAKADELYSRAKNIFEEQATKGDVNGQRNLGLLLVESDHSEDIKKGMDLLDKVAQKGDSEAQVNLAWAYTQDDAENKLPDVTKAISWYEKAAVQENINALLALSNLYPDLGKTQENMTKVIGVLTQASKQGSSEAKLELADLYLSGGRFAGAGLNLDAQKGLELLKTVATEGDKEALERLIDIYENGLYSIEKNAEEALKWSKLLEKNVEDKIAKESAGDAKTEKK